MVTSLGIKTWIPDNLLVEVGAKSTDHLRSIEVTLPRYYASRKSLHRFLYVIPKLISYRSPSPARRSRALTLSR
jgi:hypothetical protein